MGGWDQDTQTDTIDGGDATSVHDNTIDGGAAA